MLTAALQCVRVVLAVLALRGKRWAYVGFILVGLAYFPLSVGVDLNPRPCELAFDLELAALSLTKWAHIVLFGLFFGLSYVHFTVSRAARPMTMAAVMTIAMGAGVELAQGLTGAGGCRLRDLVPDAAGGALGLVAASMFLSARRRDRKGAVSPRRRQRSPQPLPHGRGGGRRSILSTSVRRPL